MDKEVIILTEAGKQFGYGHLMRCRAIAQAFNENEIKPVFYINGDADINIIKRDFESHNADWIRDCPDISNKVVILDSYHAHDQFCNYIYNKAKKVLFLDDYNRISYPGGFVLNSILGAEKIGYPSNPEVTYLLGPVFHPLRNEFTNLPHYRINKNIKKILITLGGSNVEILLNEVLKYLIPDIDRLQITIIQGTENAIAFHHSNISIKINISAQEMAQEMINHDICISGMGQTIFELSRVGIPTIGLCIADNQINNYKAWKKTKIIYLINVTHDISGMSMLPQYLKKLESMRIRTRISRRITKIVDGQGTKRIFKLLEPFIEN